MTWAPLLSFAAIPSATEEVDARAAVFLVAWRSLIVWRNFAHGVPGDILGDPLELARDDILHPVRAISGPRRFHFRNQRD